MPSSRRHFLETTSLAATSLALSGKRLLAQAATQVDARIDILPSEPIGTIAPEIYSHFIEHLGGVIYDGVWVGEKSKIPNVNGIRKAFIDAMKAVQAPVLRWPGGCFAESYDWRDGIGPAAKRPQRSAFWDQEDTNRYGTHEFMETCRAIGCQPYLAANLRALPARDFYQWVEYCNAPADSGNTLANERAANGDKQPFDVQFWGVGNESWGCGGNQTAEEYGEAWRRFTTWYPRYGSEPPAGAEPSNRKDLKLIACGPNGDDVAWTRGIMRSITAGHLPYGLSVHYYTSGDAKLFAHGDALQFDDAHYYDLLTRSSFMENVITDHWAALGEVDTQHKVKLVVDEWGAWYGKSTELKGVPSGPQYNLSQQSTMRDALLTGITLDIFQRHADKMAMANVAQSINCIHSLMLAREDKFTVTPAFHVFQMYLPHRNAQSLRVEFAAPSITNTLATLSPVGGASAVGSTAPVPRLAGLSGSASIKDKTVTLTVVNPHLDQPLTTEIALHGMTIASVKGTVLVGQNIHDHNDFDHPNAVHPTAAATGTPSGGRLTHTFPAASVTSLELTLA
ncbi:alpha-N-arabinofuranosidase [Granulicella arctica]|uniref:non-reducing end alpha-L-arabinofuranosidase n=1 Tax=Granulicella arctica TaxID=940613 RepID=A0A7Y9PF17_9BACT|nr:alpha-L-arabinofuranosidase C-terminal domain-containing protein [Granulicella arctica]NYF78721.1 alpha-N-arabinofuranosidase [Granulicella arctica]